ncbi:DUF1127 domain-containing protein [Celeribacter litoreus]|uniref:DUF1127 domain-containing protein n=1 Tax=Celeribacter litoreus TaxID=2876714 RepID=UPI001CCAE831|nr:DUF1127 domain-containing protein [Celeribacter litoreus]MCA0042437.1 DUF1127 domain-containing protein [Celeribacter litoreus]
MAHYTDTTHATHFGLRSALRNWIERVRHAYAKERAYAVTFNQLDALSDHELHDIGLSRSDITDIARATAARV